jgi:tripartite-type tricarboxylate transporter receptor subunit TctC
MIRKLKKFQFISLITIVLCIIINIEFARTEESGFPSKPIKLLFREGPGGSLDITYRALAKAVEKILGQPIICINVPGAGGNRAIAAVIQEKPDGYTLATITIGTLVAARSEKLDYSTPSNFTPVVRTQGHPQPVAVRKDAPWKTWQEFVNFAREHKGEVKVAVWGAKSVPWLALQKIEKKENVNFTYVPFPGTGEAMAAILGGHVDAITHSSAIMHSKGGELRSLLLFADGRLKSLPGVPTANELYGPGLGFTGGFTGIVGPKGLPESILMRFDDVFRKAIEDPDYQKMIEKYELLIAYQNHEEFKKGLEEMDKEIRKVLETLKE